MFLVYAAVSTRETVRCELGWLEGLMPAVFRAEQREALLARGFAVSESGQTARREVVLARAGAPDQEACFALEVLFDVFGYRGSEDLHTKLTL